MQRSTALAAILALAAPLGSVHAHGDEHGEDVHELRIELGEMYFQVEGLERGQALELEAGEAYTLVFDNRGQMQHEILLGREVVQEDGAPDGYRVNFFADVEVELEGRGEGGGEYKIEAESLHEIYLDPAGRIEVSFRVPEDLSGEWELGCFIPGHYEAGMKLPVRVR